MGVHIKQVTIRQGSTVVQNVAQILGFAARASDKRNRAKRKGEILQLLLEGSHYFLCHGATSKFGYDLTVCLISLCVSQWFSSY